METTIQITDWREYLKEGEQYLSTAVGAAARRSDIFTPEILYNITAMAIEKLIMGYLMSRGDLADNHTMVDLLDAVERNAGPQPELGAKLRYLDGYQDLCEIDDFRHDAPDPADIPEILAIGRMVKDFVDARVRV